MNYQTLLTALKSATTYREMQRALKKARDEFELDLPCKLNATKVKLQAAIRLTAHFVNAILIKFCSDQIAEDFEASTAIKPPLTDEEEAAFLLSFTKAFPQPPKQTPKQ